MGNADAYPKLLLEQSALAQVPTQGVWLDPAKLVATLPAAQAAGTLSGAVIAGANPQDKVGPPPTHPPTHPHPPPPCLLVPPACCVPRPPRRSD
jgi:hypothetical protein